ncbi:unnamed protein product [Tilletia laevis]|nr:unnamed protein product [Tilletia laevis]
MKFSVIASLAVAAILSISIASASPMAPTNNECAIHCGSDPSVELCMVCCLYPKDKKCKDYHPPKSLPPSTRE